MKLGNLPAPSYSLRACISTIFGMCGQDAKGEEHLHQLQSLCSAKCKGYGDQELRVPNLMDVQKIFYEGGYDRIICSTELMGLVALYLKTAFSVPCYFYMHTDWMDFFKRSVHLEDAALGRLRRVLRFYYKRFDGIFVLNEEHSRWLVGKDMGLDPSKVFKTSHWVSSEFRVSQEADVQEEAISGKHGDRPCRLLYVGRLSEEKGVYDLPLVLEQVRSKGLDVEVTVLGDGPARSVLETSLEGVSFEGWVDRETLIERYRWADLLLLPSRFDTFGCVVLEAMACGCPVVAYNQKGPRDIIGDGLSGYLVEDAQGMANAIQDHHQTAQQDHMKAAAVKRAANFDANLVLKQMFEDISMGKVEFQAEIDV